MKAHAYRFAVMVALVAGLVLMLASVALGGPHEGDGV